MGLDKCRPMVACLHSLLRGVQPPAWAAPHLARYASQTLEAAADTAQPALKAAPAPLPRTVVVNPVQPAVAPKTQAQANYSYGKDLRLGRNPMSPLTVAYPFPIAYGSDREMTVFDCDKGPVGVCKLPGPVFNVPVRIDLLYKSVRWHQHMLWQGTAKEKDRGEVRGGGRKPWPQKGTGRARHGSRRSPLWRKGGRIHAKRPRNRAHKLYVKERRAALKAALSAKANERRLIIVDHLRCGGDPVRLKAMLVRLLFEQHNHPRLSALLIDTGEAEHADGGRRLRSAGDRVGKGVTVRAFHQANVYELLSHEVVVMTRRAAEKLAAAIDAPLDRLAMANTLAVYGSTRLGERRKCVPLPEKRAEAGSLPGYRGFVYDPEGLNAWRKALMRAGGPLMAGAASSEQRPLGRG